MNRKAVGLSVAAAIGAILFALAFVFAPRACEGGFDLYVWSGIAALAALLTLPFVAHMGNSLLGSLGRAFGLAILGFCIWVTGLVSANVFVLCRLF